MKRLKFALACVYDTETTNYLKDGSLKPDETRAFPVLFIDNDIRNVDIANYEPDKDDKISFYRTEEEMLEKIEFYIRWGIVVKQVPVICAYNLMFDLHPLMEELDVRFDIRANAQSSTNVYTLDLYEKDTDTLLLRFWDTFHLEMRGLAAMGRTCGLHKAYGDWNYSLLRTPQTELFEQELFYAGRDVQVIPSYLRYLLHANEWLHQEDFGCRVLTKTSLVRQMARRTIGRAKISLRNGKSISLEKSMLELCRKEAPKTYSQYAMRKACFRGGFTFTAAATSMLVVRNVVSVDVTSMHHTFINGRKIPENFVAHTPEILKSMAERVISVTRDEALNHYDNPFPCAFNMRVRFHNIRLKKNSAFERWGIGLLAQSKFCKRATMFGDYEDGEDFMASEAELKSHGWYDEHTDDACFAFGKLYNAEAITVHVTEIELWSISRVYDWDSFDVIGGEGSTNFRIPPDFVTAQSNVLYAQKEAAKFIESHYMEGEPYTFNLSGIPDGIAESLRNGTCDSNFFHSWYTGTVKGSFNGIYGTMAQDILKPKYCCDGGELIVDEKTITTPENFDDHCKQTNRVLYTYGMRIVGGSRMHMIIAIELIHEFFGTKADVLGGDTDSMKIRLDNDVTDEQIDEALKPIAIASKNAIDNTMKRMRKHLPKYSSLLKGIGSFDVENRNAHYDYHMECWNKCRVSYDNRAHITCAGLSRPSKCYNMESFIADMVDKYGAEKALPMCIGFNVFVSPELSFALEGHNPKVTDMFSEEVTDYLGNTCFVNVHESTALYPTGRWLGETLKISNIYCVNYLARMYGRKPVLYVREMHYDKERKIAFICNSAGEILMSVENTDRMLEAEIGDKK